MKALCSRVDCAEPAGAVFGFDAGAALVWLDPFDGISKGAGMLCAEHADSLTPMRGWTLQDRRARAPRLWAERPRVVTPARPTPRRARRPFHQPAEPTDPLPFDAGTRLEPAERQSVEMQSAELQSTGAEPACTTDLDRLLDARTPLLARAFQSARTG
ncbi:MAG: hypothetical protein WEB19_04785 [Acidimicrobiia bacterium]